MIAHIPEKKEFLAGLAGLGGGGTGLALGGAVAKKTYLDDLFRTVLYTGQSTPKTVTTGIDMTEGGMVWVKNRNASRHAIGTQELGAGYLSTDNASALDAFGNGFNTFTSTGFTTTQGNVMPTNENGNPYASWSFKKTPGFFTVAQWTGNGSAPRSISHDLGSVPGLIIVKCTSAGSTDWMVWHRDFGATEYLTLNSNVPKYANEAKFGGQVSGSAKPTATTFALGSSNDVNGNGNTYVAYLWAGGASSAATARSVDFSPNDHLSIGDHPDFKPGTGDFTWECWMRPDTWANNRAPWETINGFVISPFTTSTLCVANGTSIKLQSSHLPVLNQWTHVAVARSGSTMRMFFNGIQVGSVSDSTDFTGTGTNIGVAASYFDGKMSNIRLVKGTALYTSSFIPPYKPLTNITNTKLLCCNNSSVTGATVCPTTISNNGCTASTDSPFDDPDGFKFGDGRDEPIVKCGSFIGSGAAYNPVYIGFEPQWLLVKNATSTSGGGEDWFMVDCMRGWPIPTSATANVMQYFQPNNSNEERSQDWADPMSDGFMCRNGNDSVNGSGDQMIYIAIRRSDGDVTDKPEAGTDSFASSLYDSTAPAFNTNFPVDFALFKRNSVYDWRVVGRLIEKTWLKANSTTAESLENDYVFDYMDGWNQQTGYANAEQSWMWKRGKGFDVVRKLKEVNRHNLGQPPEMVWTKRMDNGSAEWYSWHKDLGGGGSNAVGYHVKLNENHAESNSNVQLCPIGDSLPTATYFRTGTDSDVRNDGGIAFLFASVKGISKCGTYSGSSSAFTINLGFQPRIIIIKGRGTEKNWIVFDTTSGWAKTSMGGSETTKYWALNDNGGTTVPAVVSGSNIVCYPVATGVYFTGLQNSLYGHVNLVGQNYVYYAHA